MRNTTSSLIASFCVCSGVMSVAPGHSSAADVYFTDVVWDRIDVLREDAESPTSLTLDYYLNHPVGVTVDFAGGKMYWTEDNAFSPDRIGRANLNGSSIEFLIEGGLANPVGITVDSSAGKMYWTEENAGTINRANLDGSDSEIVISVPAGPLNTGLVGLDLDVAAGKVYFSDEAFGKIWSSNLDGSDLTTLVDGLGEPRGMAVDPGNQKMYWVDRQTSAVMQANLDGTGVGVLASGLEPDDIGIDLDAGQVYWTDNGTILRYDLNDGSTQNMLPDFAGAFGIGVAPSIEAGFNESDLEFLGPDSGSGRAPDLPDGVTFSENGVLVEGTILRAGEHLYKLIASADLDGNGWFDDDEMFADELITLSEGRFDLIFDDLGFDPAEFDTQFRLVWWGDPDLISPFRQWGLANFGETEFYGAIPEPGTVFLLALGSLLMVRRRR